VGVLLVGLLIVAAALAAPRGAAADELEILQVGWDGTVVPGTWSPVRVRVHGGAADLSGRVELVLRARYPLGPQGGAVEYPVAAYGQDLTLPAGSAKEVALWAPTDTIAAGSVRLTAGQTVMAEQPVEFRTARTPTWPLVGVLAEAPAVARSIARIELPYQGLPVPLSVARLAAADVPPQAERLSALSALVVQGNAAVGLTGEQRRTVEEWVQAGGHLVLAGGPEAPRTLGVLPADALPLSLGSVDGGAELAPLAAWIGWPEPVPGVASAVRLQARAGAVLVGTADRPLVWRLGLGQGTVTLLAADPALEPLAGWSGTPALLHRALEPALPAPGEDEQARLSRLYARQSAARLLSAVDGLPSEAFPSWQTVALILGGFALLVGPLLHLLLWRANRREWMWVAVPAAAVLVAGVLYYVGIGRGGRDVLTNVVTYVRLDPDGGPAQQALAAGFFGPTHGDLAVSVPGDVPVRAWSRADGSGMYPGVYSYPVGPAGAPYVRPAPPVAVPPPPMALPAAGGGPVTVVDGEPPYHVLAGRDTRVVFDGNEWGMRTVSLDRRLAEPVGRVTARLGLEEGLVKGSLRNDTAYPLEDAALVVGESLAKVGSLAPGQTVPVVLDPAPPARSFQGAPMLSLRLLGQPMGGPAAPPAPPPGSSYPYPPGGYPAYQIPREPELLQRQRLLDAVTGPQYGNRLGRPLTFFAFTRTPVGGDAPTAGEHPVYYLTLLEQPVQLELAPGPFAMPAGLVPSEMIAQSTRGTGGGGNGTITWVELYGGAVAYEFRPPLPPSARIEALVIGTRQVGPTVPVEQGRGAPPPANLQPGPAEAGVFRIYNWQAASWEPLPSDEEVRLQPAAPYVGPDRAIRVQVSARPDGQADGGSERLVRFLAPEVSLEGQVAP